MFLQTPPGVEILGRAGHMKEGLQREHPVHCRASAATVQGRISRGCFHSHLLKLKQNENPFQPNHVSSSALGTAQQATTELV